MKAVDLKSDEFWYENGAVSSLSMSDGKHIRFTAVDKTYNLSVENPNKETSNFPVPDDGTYYTYEIKGSSGDTYTFTIVQNEPIATLPQMIVKVS